MLQHDLQPRGQQAFGGGSSPLYFNMPVGGYVTQAFFRVFGNLTYADPGGGAAGTSTGWNPGNLLSRLRLTAVSKGPYPGGDLVDILPRGIAMRRMFDTGRAKLGGVVVDGTAKVNAIDFVIPVRFALPRAKVPIETALKTDEYKSLQWRFDTGSRDTLRTGNTMTPDYSGLTVEYYDDRENMAGDMSVLYQVDKVIPVAGVNTTWDIGGTFEVGANYLDCIIGAETTNQVLSNAILQKVTMKAQTETFYERSALQIQDRNSDEISETGESQTGIYKIDMTQDGMLTGALGVYNVGDLKFVADVLNPAAGVDRLILSSRRAVWAAQIAAARAGK